MLIAGEVLERMGLDRLGRPMKPTEAANAAREIEKALWESPEYTSLAGPTALYRLFDSDDRLLYVGIARDPEQRMRQHRRDKRWFPAVVRADIEWLEQRSHALEAELAAIRQERPVYNLVGVR